MFFFLTLRSSAVSSPDRYSLMHQARMSASINAMRVLNTGTEVEAAVADALVRSLNLIGLSISNPSCDWFVEAAS